MPITCSHCGNVLRVTRAELLQAQSETREPLRRAANDLWEEGLTQREVGERLGISQSRARVLLIQAGVDTSKKPWARAKLATNRVEDRLRSVVEMRDTKEMSFREIGQTIGVGASRAQQLYRKALRCRERGLI